MEPGDGLDNDCDGKFDEELQDSIDNDGDGEIDEDLQPVMMVIGYVSSNENHLAILNTQT